MLHLHLQHGGSALWRRLDGGGAARRMLILSTSWH
jgi:hypothetical protein